jgi:hypothetical protein
LTIRDLLTGANVVFLLGGLLFLVLPLTGEAPIYVVASAVLCFISLGLGARRDLFFSSPFRLGTCIFALTLLLAQEYSALSSFSSSSIIIASVIINGALFFLFVGCALAVARELLNLESTEEEGNDNEPPSKSMPRQKTTV